MNWEITASRILTSAEKFVTEHPYLIATGAIVAVVTVLSLI